MEIRGFRGWHYAAPPGGDVGRVLAPPYDILSADQKAGLLARSERNIVAVDLPHVPPHEAGPEAEYAQAARLLAEWQSSGVLVRDERPSVYVHEQTYQWAGRTYTRRAVVCGVRASRLGADVKPHERTHEGPIADRLMLTRHTRTQLSPIFGFHRDASGEVSGLLAQAARGRADLEGKLNNVEERLWIVSDEALIGELALVLRNEPVFIADGHHRYTTALAYRDELAAAGGIDASHEANFVMYALVAAEDPGLLVLPTHRIVRGLRRGFTVERLAAAAPQFTWQRCSVEDADLADTEAFLRRYGPGAMALMDTNPAEIWIARLTDPAAMAAAAPEEPEAWRRLDVAVLHKLIIDSALAPWRTDALFIEYTPEAASVLAACNSGRGQLGVCLRGTPLSAVEEVALAGASMPHKSTYFYPKISTGMVLKPLA